MTSKQAFFHNVTVILRYSPSLVTKSPFAQPRSAVVIPDISRYQSVRGVKRSLLTCVLHIPFLCDSPFGTMCNYHVTVLVTKFSHESLPFSFELNFLASLTLLSSTQGGELPVLNTGLRLNPVGGVKLQHKIVIVGGEGQWKGHAFNVISSTDTFGFSFLLYFFFGGGGRL